MSSPTAGKSPLATAIGVVTTDAVRAHEAFGNRLLHPDNGHNGHDGHKGVKSAPCFEIMARREALLLRLSQQIRNAPLDMDALLAVAVQEVRQVLALDRCHFLWGWTTSTASPSANASVDSHPPGLLAVTHEDKQEGLASLIGECTPAHLASLWPYLTQYQVLQVDDLAGATALDRGIEAVLRDWGMSAQWLVPVETRSGQLAAIVCGQSQPRHWQADELRLLQAITTQLAIAMDQVELHAQTRAAATAAQIQAQQLAATLKDLRKTQVQLIQSEKMSSLGRLVAGIAHEINNPINFIQGNLTYAHNYFQVLQQIIQQYQHDYPEPTPALQASIEEIDLAFVLEDFPNLLSSMQMGTERIREIVLSLRNFSRLDEAALKPVDLHEGLDSTLLILQGQLKAKGAWKGIQVQKHYGDLPLVECYASQINQVFMNLLSNAIDALSDRPDPRWIKITTTVGPSAAVSDGPPKQPVVIITIQDNGVGMSETVRQRIFDPFFTTKPVGKGTGLGLSISYQIIVEKHQGSIRCDSTLGQGTTFTIELPIQHVQNHEKAGDG
ncbi:sensor histidine kinase [Trichothermofontia sp.]